jgi:hypothetical protein
MTSPIGKGSINVSTALKNGFLGIEVKRDVFTLCAQQRILVVYTDRRSTCQEQQPSPPRDGEKISIFG